MTFTTLTISISDVVEARLRALAAERGSSPSDVAARLIELGVSMPGAESSLAPFRDEVARSGLTDEQVDAFFERLRDEVWQEQSHQRPNPEGRAA